MNITYFMFCGLSLSLSTHRHAYTCIHIVHESQKGTKKENEKAMGNR